MSEFELHLRYYVHFQTDTFGKGLKPPDLPSYWLNSIIGVLQEWLWHQITHKRWCAIKQRNQTFVGTQINIMSWITLCKTNFYSWVVCYFLIAYKVEESLSSPNFAFVPWIMKFWNQLIFWIKKTNLYNFIYIRIKQNKDQNSYDDFHLPEAERLFYFVCWCKWPFQR